MCTDGDVWQEGAARAVGYDIAPDPPDGLADITDISRMAGLFSREAYEGPATVDAIS